MANIAVFASGNGSNFQSIAEAVQSGPHRICCVICDNPAACVITRAHSLGIPCHLVTYDNGGREQAEETILSLLKPCSIDLIVLAGFMRIISPLLLAAYRNRIVNIHPSLLPKHPGTQGIRKSYYSGDRELGVTVHYVDHGVDTGPVIAQESFIREGHESIEEIENTIHRIEHGVYPKVILHILDKIANVK